MSGESLCDRGIEAERGPLVGFVLLIDKGALTWSGKAGHRPAPTRFVTRGERLRLIAFS